MRGINYSSDGSQVMAYHTIVARDETTTEHTAMVTLASIGNAKKSDGTIDPDTLLLVCPLCQTTAWVPLTGDADAQRLHAKWRAAKGTVTPYITAAVQSVIADVTAAGGVPRLDANVG
ncbi:MAG: hypothetical protein KGL39_05500 [Patescibacteria group bacterium]|nr:hypothetical protein [Patescibacteria group bacterium]